MKKWIFLTLLLALVGGWSFGCMDHSSPTSANGTPVPGGGGGGY